MEVWARVQLVRRLQRMMDYADASEPTPVFAGTFRCPKCREERPRNGAVPLMIRRGESEGMMVVCATCSPPIPIGLRDFIE
jgi:hypothetical protein